MGRCPSGRRWRPCFRRCALQVERRSQAPTKAHAQALETQSTDFSEPPCLLMACSCHRFPPHPHTSLSMHLYAASASKFIQTVSDRVVELVLRAMLRVRPNHIASHPASYFICCTADTGHDEVEGLHSL